MPSLLENLNKEQIQAVTHKGGPLLIVAGAGTGKTTVITRRIAYLVEQKLARPDEIVALTFTEKAAGEMQERADLLLPLGYYDQWICTFHGFCERILKTHALDIGVPNDFKILDDVGQWILIYKNLDKFDLDYYRPLGNPAKFIDAMLSHFSRCKDEVINPDDYLKYAEGLKLSLDNPEGVKKKQEERSKKQGKSILEKPEAAHSEWSEESLKVQKRDPSDALGVEQYETEISRLQELANAYHVYQKLLLDNNSLDFGDLINYTLELFSRRPKILQFYQKKFKFVMVDEFQDTNYAQYKLVKLLAGDEKNLTVVGDDDQSIYKFRGASVSNILKFKDDFPTLKQITLVENYRSSQNILDLAYNFIQANNPDRLEVKLGIDKRLKSNEPTPGTIQVLEGDDLSQELDLVAKRIVELRGVKSGSEASWNDFAILIRRNAAADELLPVLAGHGIPYTFVANKGLYKKPIILDILAYLKLLENCHDSHSLYRVLSLPKFKILHQELATLLHFAHKKTLSLYEALKMADTMQELGGESRIKIRKLVETLDHHCGLAKRLHAAEVLVTILKDLGIEEKIKEDTLENAENRELIEQFYKKVETFGQQQADKSVHNFLSTLNLEMEAGNEGLIKFDPNLGPESLKVMTVHAAKGLEFKYVFVINMVEQRFPTREKSEPIEIPGALIKDILPEGDFHLQEERRLFYVAVTRAKTHLYFSWAKDYGGTRAKKPSVFLQETKLVPSDSVNKATGKVIFTRAAPKQETLFYSPPTQFSYSQLNDFKNCPLRYKYQHYLKLPVAGSCHLSFGQTIHKAFEEYLNLYKHQLELPEQDLFGKKTEAKLPELKVLEELYEKSWVDDWYKSKTEKEQYRTLGKKLIKTFYEQLQTNTFQPKYVEKFFKLKIGDYNFVGKIDRADIVDGGISILDYKTGKLPKKNAKKDLDQLYIYQWAAQEFLKEEVKSLKYWFLQDNEFIEEEIATTDEIGELKTRLSEIIEEIIETTKYNRFKEAHSKVKDHKCEFEYLE